MYTLCIMYVCLDAHTLGFVYVCIISTHVLLTACLCVCVCVCVCMCISLLSLDVLLMFSQHFYTIIIYCVLYYYYP